MILAILFFGLSYYWLLRETDYLRIRLLAGQEATTYAKYTVYNMLKSRSAATILREGTNKLDSKNNEIVATYDIFVSPGVNGVLCGWDWMDKHCASMVNYKPSVYMVMGNVRYNMTIKDTSVIKDIVKANRMTRKQKTYMLRNDD